jgi:hypothetical protein
MAEKTSKAAQAAPAPTQDATPIPAGRSQPGENVTGVVTTNPPRGVDEAPSDLLADEPAARALQEHVKGVIDEETAQGYRGANTDPTPNENYTLSGVGGDSPAPTPETVVTTPKSTS